jgi:hypothetical protein
MVNSRCDGDPQSRHDLMPYTAFVVLNDSRWIYRLRRLNPGPVADRAPRLDRRRLHD